MGRREGGTEEEGEGEGGRRGGREKGREGEGEGGIEEERDGEGGIGERIWGQRGHIPLCGKQSTHLQEQSHVCLNQFKVGSRLQLVQQEPHKTLQLL